MTCIGFVMSSMPANRLFCCWLQYGKTPLMYSIESKNDGATVLLLEKGANIEAKDSVCIYDMYWLSDTLEAS